MSETADEMIVVAEGAEQPKQPSVPHDPLYCNFCGKRQDYVETLVAGPAVFICDECVDQCAEIVAHYRSKKAETQAKTDT